MTTLQRWGGGVFSRGKGGMGGKSGPCGGWDQPCSACQILIGVKDPDRFTWAARIWTRKITGTEPSSFIGMAGAQHRVRWREPLSEQTSRCLQTCAGFSAGHCGQVRIAGRQVPAQVRLNCHFDFNEKKGTSYKSV